MKFTKMQGCGNDYIYVNGREERLAQDEKAGIVRRISDRHFGIGGDGVIFINPSDEADFEMEMYNADGSRGEMCGNGIRCVAAYVYNKGLTDKKELSIISAGKVKHLWLDTKGSKERVVSSVRVDMGIPILKAEEIPVDSDKEILINEPIEVNGKTYRQTCVSMGNPHSVIFVEDTGKFPVQSLGPYFEEHRMFPNRINTEFVQVMGRDGLKMRVWERGSGETFACGTGACAATVAGILNGYTDNEVTVSLLGGDLKVEWEGEGHSVFMTGPAEIVFEGEILL